MRATWCIALTIVALGCRSDPTSDLLPLPDARPYTVDRFPDAHRAVVYFDGGASGDGTTASTDAAGKDDTFVGRIREDHSAENALNLWVVADNVRKGAALNSVQIAEILVKNYL